MLDQWWHLSAVLHCLCFESGPSPDLCFESAVELALWVHGTGMPRVLCHLGGDKSIISTPIDDPFPRDGNL